LIFILLRPADKIRTGGKALSKRNKLKFQTKKSAESAKNKRFLLFFCSFLLVFGAVSMFVLLRGYNYDLSNLFNGRKNETETTTSVNDDTAAVQGSANFLISCVSDDGNDIRFIALIHADTRNSSFKVCTVSPNIRARVNGHSMTLSDHFKAGGMKQMSAAVEAFGEIKIDRYVCTNDSGFKTAIRDAGRITLTVAKKINFRSEKLTLILSPGKQVFSGDTLLSYIRYNGQLGDNGLKVQAEIFCSLLRQYLNEYNAQLGDALFSRLINSMTESNITIVDYKNCQTAINMLSAAGANPSAMTDQLLQGFGSTGAQTTKEETTK